ncbi:glucans biosynthesis glucosyltransferase h [Stemphylium lycopersici]|nr:glucans biosynthesis glucosyltransferase h [Stemphylium lycopersici]RAQ98594.1 glucans biosynthesis glucosyltransferase h [Stemphylium lycopersici]
MARTLVHVRANGMSKRHVFVMGLHTVTLLYIVWNHFAILRPDGIRIFESLLLILTFVGCFPLTLDFWSAIIGLCVVMFGDSKKSIYPYLGAESPLPGLRSKSALTIYMRNEDPSPIFDRLLAMHASLDQTGRLGNFRFVLLSDTSDPDVMQMEETGFEKIKASLSEGTYRPAFYRRRSKNVGFKAGNAFDYVQHHSKGDEFFIPLDSDSTMSGDLLVRMASSMENNPQIGIIQARLRSTPSMSGFGRATYYVNNHIHNIGLSWFYKDHAVYWGHNAIIRTQAFLENCKLPVLKGRPPLGGYILSHDVIEAIFMRHAGYEVRLLPVETGSYEAHPPNLIEHVRRELRWCRGTLPYIVLLKQPGFSFFSRFQMCYCLSTYLGPMAWALVSLTIAIKSLLTESETLDKNNLDFYSQPKLLVLSFFPRFVGLVHLATKCVRDYGDGLRWAVSCFLHSTFTAAMAPIVNVALTAVVAGSFINDSIAWDGQNRNRLGLSWRDALRTFWLQTLIGIVLVGIVLTMNGFRVFIVLVLASTFPLVVPITVITASPRLSRIVLYMRLFIIPEEVELTPVLSSVVPSEIRALASKKSKT